MTSESITTQPTSVWLAQTLRLTTYQLDPGPIENQSSIWSQITGESPEEEQNRPKEGRFIQRGRVDGWTLDINGIPGRVDLLLNYGDQNMEEDQTVTIFRAGGYQEGIQVFRKIVEKWFEVGPPTNRIAFGAVLVQPVNEFHAGFELIDTYLPRIKDMYTEDSTDFLFQINRPRASKTIPGLKINRLSKWNVLRMGLATLRVGIEEQPVTSVTPDAEGFAVRLELDINTAGGLRDEISKNNRMDVFSEMVELGQEISEHGDIE